MEYHTQSRTPEYEEILAWYVEIVGMVPFQRRTDRRSPWINLSSGDSDMPRAPTQGRAIGHIGFEFRNREATVRRLESMRLTFDVAYRKLPTIGLNIAHLPIRPASITELTEGCTAY